MADRNPGYECRAECDLYPRDVIPAFCSLNQCSERRVHSRPIPGHNCGPCAADSYARIAPSIAPARAAADAALPSQILTA
jgi:hypothetical protein